MFGLFQSVRSKGTKAGIAAVQPMLGMLQAFSGPGIPSGMWQDPYVLGYVNATINFFAKMYTNGKARGSDLGYILMDVYTAVSHQNGMAITKYATELMLAKHPDFICGIEEAMLIHCYGHGMLKDENHPLLIQAKADAAEMGQANQKTAVAGLMVMETWSKEVRRLANRT